MLNWLRRRLINRRRAIFRYWDGTRLVADDPMRIFRALLCHSKFDWNVHPQFIDDLKDSESRDIVLTAIGEVFHVQRLSPENQSGLTEEEMLSLLWAFTHYCNSKKKSINPSPTPPPSSEPKPSSAPASDESLTKGYSDCGSMSPELKFDMPPV